MSPRRLFSESVLPLGALLLTLTVASLAPAQPAPRVEGLFISVENPITEDVSRRIRNVTTTAVQRHRDDQQNRDAAQRSVLKIVLDFTPDNRPANSTTFAGCLELSEHLLTLQDVITIAFVHGEVSRHSVLPVLACKEIVMSSEAKIGPVAGDREERPPTAPQEAAYADVIRGRNRIPAVVLKLLDPSMEILEARNRKTGDIWFIDSRREAEEAKEGFTVTQREPIVGKGPAVYTTAQAKAFGLCQAVRESRQEVAEAYQLPAASLREDPLLGGSPVVGKVTLTGPVTMGMYESLKRGIRQAIAGRDRKHANFILLQLECGGGDLDAAYSIAKLLRTQMQDSGEAPIKTVAYVPRRAPDTAAIIALGCNEIVLGKGAEFGDFSNFAGPPGTPPNQLRIEALRKLALEQNYPPLLVQGFLDRDLTLHYAKSIRGVGEWKLLDDDELKRDRDGKEPRWEVRTLVKPPNQLLVLNAETAKDIGLVRHVVDGVPQLYEAVDIKESQVSPIGNDWLDDLAYFLRRPEMTVLLVLVGFICLFIELKIPGISFPGVIAALCFVLLFWANTQFVGEIPWLAILLFLLALVLIALEIFVLPGFGVVGVSGAVLLILSLALVAMDQQPRTSQEWAQFGGWIATFAGSLVAAIVAAFTFIWYLPNIPYLNRLILKPALAGADGVGEEEATQPPLARLLGDIGVAATPLRPAGKVKFGDEYVDVVSEGTFVPEGTRVQVIEIEGMRIVVKEV